MGPIRMLLLMLLGKVGGLTDLSNMIEVDGVGHHQFGSLVGGSSSGASTPDRGSAPQWTVQPATKWVFPIQLDPNWSVWLQVNLSLPSNGSKKMNSLHKISMVWGWWCPMDLWYFLHLRVNNTVMMSIKVFIVAELVIVWERSWVDWCVSMRVSSSLLVAYSPGYTTIYFFVIFLHQFFRHT